MSARRPLAGRRHSRGFTLVELMVAVAIGMFMMIGLVSLIVSTTSSRTELDKSSRQIENGRYAIQLLSQDIQLAGFTGEMSTSSLTPQAPVACPAAASDLKYTPSTSPGASVVPMPVYAVTSTAAAGCATNIATGAAILVVSRADTVPVSLGTAGANSNEVYLQVSTCANDTLPFAASTGTAAAAAATAASAGTTPTTFSLMQKDCVTKNPAPVRKLVQRLYYVSSCNVCGTGAGTDTTPTLKMVEFVDGTTKVTPLVEGIEDLQFDYGIDMDGNGSPDCYVSDPGSQPSAQTAVSVCPQTATPYDWTAAAQNWANVMAVRIHVLARSTDTSAGWTDSRSYDMGLAEPAVTKNDHYKRHAYSAVVRLYNGSGQRETP